MDAPIPTAQTIDSLVQLVVGSLPDSIAERRRLLTALVALLPESYASRVRIVDMLVTLEQHEQLQRELPGLSARDPQAFGK